MNIENKLMGALKLQKQWGKIMLQKSYELNQIQRFGCQLIGNLQGEDQYLFILFWMGKGNQARVQGEPERRGSSGMREPLIDKQMRDELIDQQQHFSHQRAAKKDKSTKIKQHYELHNKTLQGRNIFSKLFFYWIGAFAAYGNHFQVTKDSAPILPDNQKPRIQFDRIYNILKSSQRCKTQGLLLAKSIGRAFLKDFMLLIVQMLFFVGLSMYGPILTHQIINYIEEGTETREISKGVTLFIGVFFLAFGKLIAQSHVYYNFGILGFNLSNTLSLLLYEKSLKHPIQCLKKYSVSQIINYSQVDAQRMTYMGFQLASLIFTPFEVIIGLYLMYNFIGISFLSGVGVMVITVTCTFIFSKISIRANENVLRAKDQRMKSTQQLLNIIRFIKVNAFEKFFWQRLNSKRQTQLKLNKKKLMYEILNVFVFWLASPLILSMTFATYTWLGNDMTAAEAFTTIMLFRILQYPMRLLPTAISQMIQIWTSIQRIQKFLLSQEIDQKHIKVGNPNSFYAIKIVNGTFAWAKEKKKKEEKQKLKKKSKIKRKISKAEDLSLSLITDTAEDLQDDDDRDHQRLSSSDSILGQSMISIDQRYEKLQQNEVDKPEFIKALKDITLGIQAGSFTMIIGDIGSGKSSILFSILNQMKASKNAMVEVNGSLAYVPQKPWIMSGTVRDNITFTLPYNKQKFHDVIKHASMTTDLGLLVNRDLTQIGEKGANLSGGQKARIGLARALYSERDIYLLDDIISAVDVHVGEFIMKETILKYLKKKTVIMPTHAVKFAEFADKIIIMKKGKVALAGKYSDIKDSKEFKQIRVDDPSQKKGTCKQEQKVIADLTKIKSVQDQRIRRIKTSIDRQQSKPEGFTAQIIEQLIIPEDQQKGSIGLDVYKEYIKLNGGFRFLFIVSLCMTGWLGFTTISNVWMEKWCEAPHQGNEYLYIFLGLSVASSLFMLVRAYVLVIGGIKCGGKVHKKITKALLYASLTNFYNRVPLGRIVNRLSKDLRQIDESIGYSVGSFIASLFGLLGTLVICIYASTWFVFIPIAFVGYASNRFRLYYMKTQRQCVRLDNITSSPIVSGFLSTINGIETIRAYNLEEKFLHMQIQKVDQNKRLRVTRQALESWFVQRLSLITFSVNMTAIGYCIFSQNENSSLAGLLLAYALTLADDIIDTMFSFTSLEARMVSVERISTFMKIQPQQGYKKYTQEWRTKEQGFNEVIKKGEITFIDSKVRYRPELPLVLKGVSLHINKGQKVGIVGRTGAGKSTITNCLLRILECSQGKIQIDGKNVKDYFLKDLRSNITMIDQEPTLINATFRENLDPRMSYTSQQLMNVVKECNLLETIEEKGGLDGQVTNDSLSVGEKQLLCICRAFLKQSKIVLVDEATANIDQKNDQLIQEVISTKFKESTVLTIAHRLSTLKNSDKILVLGEGKVLEWGSPQELLGKDGGIYREMSQKGNITEEYLI